MRSARVSIEFNQVTFVRLNFQLNAFVLIVKFGHSIAKHGSAFSNVMFRKTLLCFALCFKLFFSYNISIITGAMCVDTAVRRFDIYSGYKFVQTIDDCTGSFFSFTMWNL